MNNHVNWRTSFLLLLFLQFICINFTSTTSIITDGKGTPPPAADRRVTIANITRTVTLEKFDDRGPWNFLDDLESLNDSKVTYVMDRLKSLGILIYALERAETSELRLKYRRSFVIKEKEAEDDFDEDSFDEVYPLDYSAIAIDASGDLLPKLMESIEKNWLLRATLILNDKPELIAVLPEAFYSSHVLVRDSTVKGVHKYLMIQRDPSTFMAKYLNVFKAAAERIYSVTELIEVLREVLVDLKVTDESVNEAFRAFLSSSLFQDEAKVMDAFPILSVFLASKRRLILPSDQLNRICFGGNDHVKERIGVLKFESQSEVVEQVVLACFNNQNAHKLLPNITKDKEITSKLSQTFFTQILLPAALKTNNLDRIKLVFADEFIGRLSEAHEEILPLAVEFVNWNILKFLIGVVRPKNHRFPLFSRKDLISAAFKSIQLHKNDLFIHLIEDRLVTLSDRVNLPNGSRGSLLAAIILYKNYDLIKSTSVASRIDWFKCEDVRSVAQDLESKELLNSIGMPSSLALSPMDTPEYSTDSEISTFSPNAVNSITRLINQQQTDPFREYEQLLLHRNDSGMCSFLQSIALNSDPVAPLRRLQTLRGFFTIIWELCDANMLRSLDAYLDNIKSIAQIHQVAIESIKNNCAAHVLGYFLKLKKFSVTDRIGDRNIIAHLFKAKNVELAFELIREHSFNIKHSDSPEVNPEGDIILSAAWNPQLMDRLLSMGASPNVRFYSIKTNSNVSLLDWARQKRKTEMAQVLSKYVK